MKLRDGYYLDFDKDLAFKRRGKWYFYSTPGFFQKSGAQSDWESSMQQTGTYLFGMDLLP